MPVIKPSRIHRSRRRTLTFNRYNSKRFEGATEQRGEVEKIERQAKARLLDRRRPDFHAEVPTMSDTVEDIAQSVMTRIGAQVRAHRTAPPSKQVGTFAYGRDFIAAAAGAY